MTKSKESCEHFVGMDESSISPKTSSCDECEKEGTDWVALRMCLICGHVGCCDSSTGLHATNILNNLVSHYSALILLSISFKIELQVFQKVCCKITINSDTIIKGVLLSFCKNI